MFYKIAADGYIVGLGTIDGPTDSPVITPIEAPEFEQIAEFLRNRPPRTETADYRLREDLTWEEYPVEPPDPDPEIDDLELLEILMGGAG